MPRGTISRHRFDKTQSSCLWFAMSFFLLSSRSFYLFLFSPSVRHNKLSSHSGLCLPNGSRFSLSNFQFSLVFFSGSFLALSSRFPLSQPVFHFNPTVSQSTNDTSGSFLSVFKRTLNRHLYRIVSLMFVCVSCRTQFYLCPDDLGVNRAEATKDRLQQLNSYVHVKAYTQTLTEEYLKNFHVLL